MTIRGYEAVIGIEVHVQLKTKSKIFSSDANGFSAQDNENIHPITLGMPGTLPVTNQLAVEYAVKTGLALGCNIRRKSVFARKNYFYPDLPKGYQISQYDQPICEQGKITIDVDGKEIEVSITRAHLEEDAGKSTHVGEYTLLNYNRAGVPLLEIVSGPDMKSAAEAAEYGRSIRQIVRYLDVCDGNLEEGSLRCDCNVSVRPVGSQKLGTKVEIKNINSFRFIEKAIDFEIERQVDMVERGEKILQETRLYDPDKNKTISMRSKEDAQDYRYFPDPDLLPILISDVEIQKWQAQIPELPRSRARRLVAEQGLPHYDAQVLTAEKELADYFENTAQLCRNYKAASNWIMTELVGALNQSGKTIGQSPVAAASLAKLISLIDQNQISGKIAKSVFQEMFSSGQDPGSIISKKGLAQISDPQLIEKLIDEVMAANPSQVQDFRAGKAKLMGFFVGAVMRLSKGQANPDLVNSILHNKLTGK